MRAKKIGRYEIVEELSSGGMGVVYKARDPLIDRIVAIKTIGMGLSSVESEAFDKRFDREARSAGRLNHPNIVTIYDMGHSGEGAYIAMEFLDGRSLRNILDTGVVLPAPQVAQIAVQVADGLAFAHENDVIHCDIKPANIMVLASGVVKITDFGIARLPTGSRTFGGNVFGSPRYISPEQIVGRPVDARSDIFALGAVLYEMLTGVPPFGGAELDEILYQVINDKPLAPSARNSSLAHAFDDIVLRALAKAPDDRYPSARMMAADLRKLAPEPAVTAADGPRAGPGRSLTTSRSATLLTLADERSDLVIDPLARTLDMRALATLSRRKRMALYATPALLLLLGVGWALWPGPAKDAEPGAATGSSTDRGATDRQSPPVPAASGDSTSAASMPAADSNTAASAVPGNADATPHRSTAQAPALSATVTPAASISVVPAPRRASAPIPPSSSATPATDGGATQAAARPQARVVLAVSPWGEVYVDGNRRGVSPPLRELRLAPGRHTIEVRNSTFEPHSETVDLRADASVRIKHKFQ